MDDLKSWYDFLEERKQLPYGAELTGIACPCCGKALYEDKTMVLTSYPEKHRYFCNSCKWSSYV